MTAAADRHLLFGLLALQNGPIDQAALVAAFQAWTRDKSTRLADRLLARGDLDAAACAGLEAIVALHVKKHGDVEKTLAAVPANRSTRASLAALGEPEFEATLARVTRSTNGYVTEADNDPDRTSTLSVRAATSEGQRFCLLRPHARGGLGEVFVALDSELHREVALKQILEKHADDPVSRQRFVVEAEITGGREHPGIAPIYGLETRSSRRPGCITYPQGQERGVGIDFDSVSGRWSLWSWSSIGRSVRSSTALVSSVTRSPTRGWHTRRG